MCKSEPARSWAACGRDAPDSRAAMRRRPWIGRSATAAAVLATLALSMASQVMAADLCADVAEIRDAHRDFTILRGAPAPERDTWAAKRPLIDASWQCRVESLAGDQVLTCVSAWGVGIQQVREQMSNIVDALNGCLGDGWQHRGDRSADRASAIYFPPDGSAEIDAFFESREAPGTVGIAAAAGLPQKRQVQWRLGVVSFQMPGSVLGAGEGNAPPDVPRFCEALQQVVAAADTRFDALRGAKSGDSWDAKLTLPGLTQCGVTDYDTSVTYSCRAGKHDGFGDLRRQQESMAIQVTHCLGADWTVKRRPRGNGIWTFDIGRIGKDGKEAPVSMELRGRKTDDAYMLHVDVDRSIE
jgi:hypothetical protein